MSNLKAAVGEKEAAAIRKRLNTWAKTSNPTCADCSRTNPTWASVNLGVLVCLQCAGRHRSLGTHITKMRSITLDTILPEEALFLMNMTNVLANKYWEATLPEAERVRAIQGSHFISQKYGDRRWALGDSSVPVPSAQCVPHTHPWWRDAQAAVPAAPAAPASAPQKKPAIQLPVRQHVPPQAPTAAPVADLIDFGEFESAPEPAPVSKSASSDPFGSMSTSAGTEPAVAAGSADPFASAAGPASMPASASQPALAQPQQMQDPFSSITGMSASHSMPQGLNYGQVPRHSSAPGQVPQHPSPSLSPQPQPAFMAQPPQLAVQAPAQRPLSMSNPSLPTVTPAVTSGLGAAPVAGGGSAAESKAAMNARILALYNQRPTSAPNSAGMPGTQAGPQPVMQNTAQPGMVPPSQFSAATGFGPQRPS